MARALRAALAGARGRGVTDEVKQLFGDTPDAPLTKIKQLLVSRRHWELLVQELPDVVHEAAPAATSPRAFRPTRRGGPGRGDSDVDSARSRSCRRPSPPAVKLDPLRQPEVIKRLLCRYRVGGETILGEAGGDHFTRTVANLMVVAWNALTAGHKLGFLRPVGWGLRLLRILALAVVRAPLGGRAAAERHSRCQPRPRRGQGLVRGRLTAAAALLAAAAVIHYWATSWLRAILFALVVVAVTWAAFNLGGDITLTFGSRQWHQTVEGIVFLVVLVAAPLIWWLLTRLRWLWARRDRTADAKSRPPAGTT